MTVSPAQKKPQRGPEETMEVTVSHKLSDSLNRGTEGKSCMSIVLFLECTAQ